MPDEDLLESMDDLGEEEEDEAAAAEENPLMRYLPLIAGILVIQVVIGYVLVTWWFSPGEEATEEPVEEVAAPIEEVAPAAGPLPTGVGKVFDRLEVIVVNPAGTEGLRFLSTQVHLGLSDPKVEEFIDDNNLLSKINDTLIGIFASKTIEDLAPSKHDALKEEVKEQLNLFLGEHAVLEVYFQSFVLQ